MKVNSYPVLCITYDDLAARLINKVDIHLGISEELAKE